MHYIFRKYENFTKISKTLTVPNRYVLTSQTKRNVYVGTYDKMFKKIKTQETMLAQCIFMKHIV